MDQLIVAGITLVALVFFVTELIPADMTAVGVLVGLLVTGILTPGEALSGFSSPATITVAALFILSTGLSATGVVAYMGMRLTELTSSRPRLLLPVLLVTIAFISAFINNTAAVAVFLPLVLTVTRRRAISPSRYLLPLSFTAQLGGTSTLIGTSTNILISTFLVTQGLAGISMFELTPIGVILTLVGIVYLLVGGQRLIPERRPPDDLEETYGLDGFLSELRVTADSPFVGLTVEETKLGEEAHVRVIGLFRGERAYWRLRDVTIREGDVLLVRAKVSELLDVVDRHGLRLNPTSRLGSTDLRDSDRLLVEALVGPRSWLQGRTIRQVDFRWRYRAIVVAMRRQTEVLRQKLGDVPLRLGDSLLLQIDRRDLERLKNATGFIILGAAEQQPYRRRRAPMAITIMVSVVALAAFDVMPIVIAALLGVVAMVITRCVAYEDLYRSVDWPIILLLAGILPLGLALEKTGLAAAVADQVVALGGGLGPRAVLAGIWILTVLLTAGVSNNAVVLLMAPIGLSVAQDLSVDPRPFLVAITLGASVCFLTPVGYQTNAMILGPGSYRFSDFARVGLPLTVVMLLVTVLLVPMFWPF